MKYIILDVAGLHLPYLFPVTVNHSDMMRALGREPKDVISAGAVRVISGGRVSAINGSVTLNKIFDRTRTHLDNDIIQRHLCNA